MKRRHFMTASFSLLPFSVWAAKNNIDLVNDLEELDFLRELDDEDFVRKPQLQERYDRFDARHPKGSMIYKIFDKWKAT